VDVDPVTGEISYTHDGGDVLSDLFTYRVANNLGRFSTEARVSIDVDTDLPPLALADSAVINTQGETVVDVLLNDTDDIGLDASTLTIVSQPLGGTLSVDPISGVVSYAYGGAVLEDSFSYTVADSTGQLSNEATVSLGIGEGFPADGLVLQLESDQGVVESGGVVAQWQDQSGNGNDLISTGDPRVQQDDLFLPVIRLDGDGDRLERLSELTNLPTGSSDRSLFMLVRYDSPGFGGFAYGTADTNEAFGLVVNNIVGRYGVQGWGADNDFISNLTGTGQGWVLQSAVLNDDEVVQALNGAEITRDVHTFDTQVSRMLLGANLSGGPQVDMSVGAVLLYDRALSGIEQAQVFNYLDEKYGVTTTTDPLPIARDDTLTLPQGTSASVAVLSNDSDIAAGGLPGALDELSLEIVVAPQNGVAVVSGGQITYSHGGAGFVDEFSYRVRDTLGQPSNVATVRVSNLPSTGLVAHYEADNAVGLDGSGHVSVLRDRSGRGNDLTGVGDVEVVADGLNGAAVLSFDGVGDALVRTGNLNGLPLGGSARTVYQVVRYDSVGSGGFGYGIRSGNRAFGLHVQAPDGRLRVNGFGPTADIVSETVGTGRGWVVHSVVYDGTEVVHELDGVEIDRVGHVFNTGLGPIVLGADLDQVPYVDMDVAALLVYDRALSEGEQGELEAYLDAKYNAAGEGAPLVANDAAEVERY